MTSPVTGFAILVPGTARTFISRALMMLHTADAVEEVRVLDLRARLRFQYRN